MYTENPARDMLLFGKAVISNQIARFAPSLYVRLTAQTGRGREDETPQGIAAYFTACCEDYFNYLGVSPDRRADFLRNRRILEYGPGDVLGVALLMYAYGAAYVHCVDRFPLEQASEFNLSVYRALLRSLDGAERERASSAFREHGNPASGLRDSAIRYSVTANGLSQTRATYDLIISRAVLEHVNDLAATMRDISTALKPGGVSVHCVDLRSHGLDRYRSFDFLTWPEPLYRLMYSHKGFPNRWRADTYESLARDAGLDVLRIEASDSLPLDEVSCIQRYLAPRYRGIPPDRLAWKSFWMVLRHRALH